MQKRGQRVLCVVFSFLFLFICTGYAQLAETLTVTGDLSYQKSTDYVCISDVTMVDGSASNLTAGAYEAVFPTNLENAVTVTGNGASVRYKITFKNMSYRYTYTFKGVECMTVFSDYDHDLYSTTAASDKFTISLKKSNNVTNFTAGTSIGPQEEVVVYATYSFGNAVDRTRELSFLMNYKFGVHVESMGEMAVEKTMTSFLGALNTPENYNTLIVNIDNKYTNADWQANYIGNVSQAGDNSASEQAKADAVIVESLIGSGLTLTVDGVEKKVTVMIKRENLDNNERTGDAYTATNGGSTTKGRGCEMTIYMTPNNLDRVDDEGEYSNNWWDTQKWAEVYVSVSTCTNSGMIDNRTGNYTILGEWYQIGDIYEGIANIVSYEGDGNGKGSFVTDNWKSVAKTYRVTENYSYNVAANVDIDTLVQAKDNNANNEFARLLRLAQDEIAYIDANSDYFKIAEYAQPVATLRQITAEAEAMTVDANTTRASLIPVLKALENATYPFQSFITQ
ncbi:MAG: hypothetical protein IJD59_01430 [Clostridia bacterium]|nr:hypothetical protein [Clostridia bacterium]